ncbi:MAG: ATP-binding protein [Proteiniphilum sp.]|nr:ATP-binding protein [Proteiniphilum sp.]
MKAESQFQVFEAVPGSLEPIRDFIASFATANDVDKKKIFKLILAVDEIASNIMNYGYPMAGIDDGTIQVSIGCQDGKLRVVLEDNAIPFNPIEKSMPTPEDLMKPVEDRPIGGLGIFLARQSVDLFDYEYRDGKNRNILVVAID